MSEYLKFYFAVDEDEIEEHESILTEQCTYFDRVEFVRRCFDSYLKIEKNVGKAFDEAGHIYNYAKDANKVFRSKDPDEQVLHMLRERNDTNNSIFGY